MDMINLAIGGGLILMLMQINKQLGCIKAVLSNLVEVKDDHEERIRELEKHNGPN